ncbi:MAG TPA: type VI secretion system baseplate subunit TssF [Kofleriaceae bacterium]|nr:type VI secretion system baseplate subunit TssF [Kofleriaceae bacterium]
MSRGFYDDFLTELKAVDDFLAFRTGDAHVQREDPDVRRLVESIAFFSARTRQVAQAQLRHSMLQLARGQLDDFLAPEPARGLVQASPAGMIADTAHLPAGTLVRLTTMDGEIGLFSTMVDVTLRPLQIDLAELHLRPGGGFRLAIRIRARREIADIAEPLTVHLSYLQDYQASLRFHYRLRRHLLPEGGASVCYDAAPEPARPGAPCELRFGSAPRKRAEPGSGSPVEALRTFLHFPAGELCFQVVLPRPAAPWRQAWLCLDLDEEWPSELVVNRDVFRLFVIPIENLVRDAALPIKCDGTRARFPILPARPDAGLALHSVIGVFQETPAGREPILPVHLASGDPSYDVEQVAEDGDAWAPQLALRLPAAFTAPRLISVDARWYQPAFDRAAAGKLDVKLQTRHVHGVELRLLGALTPHRSSALWRDPAAMLHVLSRRASRVLGRRDLTSLMAQLGADSDSHHAGLDAELLHVEAYEEPADLRRGGGLRQVYRITIGDLDDDRLALMEDYLRCIETLLDAWSAGPVRLEVQRRISGARPLLLLGGGA